MPTLSQLITRARRRLDDKGRIKPFFDDAWFTDAFNEAEQEACIRARLLIDDQTADCCVVTLDETHVEYELDPRVLDVEMARIPNRRALTRTAYEEIAEYSARALERANVGEPLEYALRDNNVGGSGKRLILSKPPNTDLYTELHLVVRRLPLADMVVPDLEHSPTPIDPTPEINPQLHRSLIHWVAHVAYDSQDADRGDASKAEKALARFEAAFGTRPSANVERKRLRHRPSIVAPDSTFRATGNNYYRRYRPRHDTP